jgi:hypothetical protein
MRAVNVRNIYRREKRVGAEPVEFSNVARVSRGMAKVKERKEKLSMSF